MPILILILTLFIPRMAQAYPEFIGYGYKSCLTCHFNGQGNGPLNDYGRALWASEIAGRAFAGGRSDEQLAEASGFFGSRPMPWWIRPGIKARQLAYVRQLGKKGEPTRSVLMQLEANTAIFFNKKQTLAFIGSLGYAPTPRSLAAGETTTNLISREHYFRYQASESLWISAGMMDKVYGLRIVNHTAYSRIHTGLAMNDQSHGVVFQYIKPEWEATANVFAGNLNQDAPLRQKGASFMLERDIAEMARLGVSTLASSNNFTENHRFGVHGKFGFGHGSAILLESGLITNIPKSGVNKTRGYYVYSEAMQRLWRGFHVMMTGQAYKRSMVSDQATELKFGIGALVFPMQRFEWRIDIENTQSLSFGPSVTRDSWSAMGQIHVAL